MKKFFTIAFISMVLLWVMHSIGCVSANATEMSEKELRAYASENNTWVVCYQQGVRTSNFDQYDATDQYLYISYSKHNCVDIYDMRGVFLYSFLFPERQNGSVSVRCENNQVYIRTKDDDIYIFDGVEEVEHMDYDTAQKKGYDFFWFYDNNPRVTIDGKEISWLSESGDAINQIPTPSVIKETMP